MSTGHVCVVRLSDRQAAVCKRWPIASSFTNSTMSTKTSAKLTLFDKLSRLTFLQAVKHLGPEGKRLINEGGT